MGALEMDVAARVLAGDPFRFARGKRDLAVDRQCELERDARAAGPHSREPAGERSLRGLAADTQLHLDPRGAQAFDALARRPWVRVLQRDHHPRRFRLDQQVGAGRPALAGMRAGLESHIDGSALCPAPGLLERDRLGMRPAAARGRAPADDLAARSKRSRSRHWGWARFGRAILAQPDRLGHEPAVGAYIPSWFSSFWNCRCRSLFAASLAAWSFFWSAMISASVRFGA